MTSKKLVLGAAAACAALASLTATAASADPWNHGWRGGGYYDRDDYGRGGSVDQLFAREDRLADQIRRLSYDERFNRWEASRAWRGLSEARQQTMREAREHGRFLPPDDYYRISARLNELQRFIGREARDFD